VALFEEMNFAIFLLFAHRLFILSQPTTTTTITNSVVSESESQQARATQYSGKCHPSSIVVVSMSMVMTMAMIWW
jgi:hypothetical protein